MTSAELISLLADLKEEEVLELTRAKLDANENPAEIFEESRKAMEIVGKRFAAGEYFLPDLVYSGEILRQIAELAKPKLNQETRAKSRGKVVIGTVAGDIHDIGLNIVEFMLDVNSFEVYNLGVDVPAEKFVQKIKETDASILGLSGFLSIAFDAMKDTVKALEVAGLRQRTKIMVGGGLIDDKIRKYTSADAFGKDAMAAVSLAKEWTGAD